MADSWLRDSLIWTLVLYVVAMVVLAPWGDLGAPVYDGSDPHPLEPAYGYQHHNTTVRFTWSSLSVSYELHVSNSTGAAVVSQNLTDESSYQTRRLLPDDYTWVAWYLPIDGAPAEIVATGIFTLDASAKQQLEWDAVSISYDFRLLPAPGAEQVRELAGTPALKADVEGLDEGEEYWWQVRALDSNGHATDWSLPRSIEVGTTQFLAFEVFSEWELALLLVGMILVVALQAGVFLAREERE
ncbi:MAG: hypothetical protein BEU05_01785 [Marine Group III euryarchaeote CG-Bathy2]|uniref:Fibronectin type-III domain-containing protein n=4 Tax=Methanobacteriati TaxID=3366610 RepID=A0A075HYP4_9EURY|nr:hypothetical protein [uncultured marine group II/III euryarchaeote KM3_141_A08]AIF20360.1 hypothetical protein [uncultured marine group II/III euryarchaeote KM3_89_F04]AIF20665.1 hypothetical protein [uncultured marine group II/III euryarchaeote KM3_91_D09]OIR10259.1 MAG: hypothetical protein BEU05_01785 [Marine Group III euryarchaeote CG-Bathy2]